MRQHSTTTAPVARDNAPLVQLVDFDGSPIEAPKRPAALSWPVWCDLIRVRCGASDDDLERVRISVGLGDALTAAMWKADNLGQPVEDDFDRAMQADDDTDPIPAALPDSFPYMPGSDDEPGDDQADDDLALFEKLHPVRALLASTLPPIAGGSPDADPVTAIDVGRLGALADALYGDAPTSAV